MREAKMFIVFFALLGLTAFLPALLSDRDGARVQLDSRFKAPSPQLPFGTDELGRDYLARVGSGYALTIRNSVMALGLSLLLGISLGSLAGWFYRSWQDKVISWVIGVILSLPFLLTLTAALMLFEPNLTKAYLLMAMVLWALPARVARVAVAETKREGFILTKHAMGLPLAAVFFHDVLLVSVRSCILFSVAYFPEIVGLEVGLSFFGLGAQPPQAGLGQLIFQGLTYLNRAPWLALIPAAILAATVFAGSGLRWLLVRRTR